MTTDHRHEAGCTADLAAIRARLEAATPGPWELNRYPHGGGRAYVETTLIADFYEERDREFLFHAPADIAALLAEVDSLKDALTLAMRALDTACGVLQEASGLPDGVDDPDCRDEMVLALRPRAEAAEAERDAALARLAKVEVLTYASDDGTEYEHNGHDAHEGEPECPGCWATGIRAALGGEDA